MGTLALAGALALTVSLASRRRFGECEPGGLRDPSHLPETAPALPTAHVVEGGAEQATPSAVACRSRGRRDPGRPSLAQPRAKRASPQASVTAPPSAVGCDELHSPVVLRRPGGARVPAGVPVISRSNRCVSAVVGVLLVASVSALGPSARASEPIASDASTLKQTCVTANGDAQALRLGGSSALQGEALRPVCRSGLPGARSGDRLRATAR